MGVNLSLGGFSEECEQDLTKRYNSHVLINTAGEIVANYRKTHLYDVDLAKTVPGGVSIMESKYCKAGDEIIPPIKMDGYNLGLTICYDLRFPEIYRLLRMQGADVMLVPSAFMVKTGQAHWETLLKARAIENQCYIVAAAQCGIHNSDETDKPRESYGHSIAIDPWGQIVGEVRSQSEEGFFLFEIDNNLIKEIRNKMPCMD